MRASRSRCPPSFLFDPRIIGVSSCQTLFRQTPPGVRLGLIRGDNTGYVPNLTRVTCLLRQRVIPRNITSKRSATRFWNGQDNHLDTTRIGFVLGNGKKETQQRWQKIADDPFDHGESTRRTVMLMTTRCFFMLIHQAPLLTLVLSCILKSKLLTPYS